MTDISKLWRLQTLEQELAAICQAGAPPALQQGLKELKKQIEQTQNSLRQLKANYQEVKEQAAVLEQQAAQLRENCRHTGDRIYNGSLQLKEIANYQQKYDQLKQDLTRREDRQLELMQLQEDIQKEWTDQKQRLAHLTEQYKERHRNYLQEKENKAVRSGELAGEIDLLIKEINPAYLNRYRQLKTKFNNPVSKVSQNTCSGCHLGLPFDLLKQLKRRDGMVCCNHCGRLLFLPIEGS
ncbi:C4-type zinc ribbon domain-containing protein [Desulfotomaculum varum]